MAAVFPEILALGEAMIEFNQSQPGRPEFLQGFGGDTSNFCIAAARQGASTGFVSAIGDDPFGRLLADMWASEQVDTTYVRIDRAAPTGVYFVTHGADGHQFDYLRAGSAASRYATGDLPLDALAAAKAVHLSGISLAISTAACDAAFAAIDHARRHGAKVSFDTNLRLKLWPLPRARAVMREALRQTDICLPSWDDVTALTGANDRDAIVDAMLEHGPQVVALKLGKEGVYVATPNERRVVPGFAVEAVDATGAGDCFGGAFVARIVAGDDPFAAARYANAAAALSTTGYGAVAPIPRRDAVERLMQG
ncbi:sugar kinase [Burkholderia cenocepacia]|uniref:2-dehydro-3-deoxygluconokinase n=7 Tax=Bacteria TaxID=2 RepID=A0A1V2W9F3_9BURK|nr:sugar kinase [Burkholderia cenocepacia]MBR8250758.1 sugar kinase [Burkholderia cenocepacia]MBR8290529.1 sugar kinase [Burkholderia cenocepacia]MDN7631609.1 sugar kinase [Burkholderia cenocepacia]ONJ14019.1 2-dehydro-3-deoxygluconokinase [Burkholderia cenocepacia]ONJ29877.1 2-dehydro-3-deoxygluconokinase [Burkholderia cenocepacia]